MNTDRLKEFIQKKLHYKNTEGQDTGFICPFCEKDGQSGTLHINFTKESDGHTGKSICHKCRYRSGDLLWLIRDICGGTLPANLERLAERPLWNVDLRKLIEGQDDKKFEIPAIELPASFRKARRDDRSLVGRAVWNYLTGRGLEPLDIDRYGVGYFSGTNNPAFGYAIFPYHAGGKTIYWQGRRVLGGMTLKQLNPSLPKAGIIYGLDEAAGQKQAFLCEAPMDAITWGPGGLALSAKHVDRHHVQVLKSLRLTSLIVCMDDDATTDTMEIRKRLRKELACQVGCLILKSGDDPNAIGRKRLKLLAKTATLWTDPPKIDRAVWKMKQAPRPQTRSRTSCARWFSETFSDPKSRNIFG